MPTKKNNRQGQAAKDAELARLRAVVDRNRYLEGLDAVPIRHVPSTGPGPPRDPWDERATDIGAGLASIETEAVRVEIEAGRPGSNTWIALYCENVGRATRAETWLSLMVRGEGMRRTLLASCPWDASLTPPWTLPLQTSPPECAPFVAVWEPVGKPIDNGRAAINIIRDALGRTRTEQVRVRCEEIEGAALSERTHRAAITARRIQHDKVLAHCAKCGRELRDPAYAAVGIGPECIKSYSAKEAQLRRELQRAADAGTDVRLNSKAPEKWLAAAVDRWKL